MTDDGSTAPAADAIDCDTRHFGSNIAAVDYSHNSVAANCTSGAAVAAGHLSLWRLFVAKSEFCGKMNGKLLRFSIH